MSSNTEKKSRGVAGLNNALVNPFRSNGFRPDWQVARLNVHSMPSSPSGGSTTMRGLVGGILVMRVKGYIFVPDNPRYERMFVHASARCTVKIFKEN